MAKMYPAGIVTAYGAAVRGGYKGTYEEYCSLMYSLLARKSAVASKDETKFSVNGNLVDVIGIPEYISDPTEKVEYGIEETGWYVFARLTAAEGVTVGDDFMIGGHDGVIWPETGDDHVDIAVKFDVAAMSKVVTVDWNAGHSETFAFRATDLSVRNLEYRVTFYIYDIAPYATWEFALTADTTFAANKKYYTLNPDGETYTLAEVTADAEVPADTYYNHSKLHFEGMTKNVTYRLDEMVDCPIEITLPEIADDGHGAWFEIQMRYDGSYSCTLLPPEGVKIGTAQTQSQGAGINTIDLQYTDVDDVQMWTLLNTHSNIPAESTT